jgi:cyclophilin family peptidyl-prolyl cis-trans isomerase
MRSSISVLLASLCLIAGSACSTSDDDPSGDAGASDSATNDVMPDAEVDASPDAVPEAAPDATQDTVTADTATDTASDTAAEATGPALVATIVTSMGTIRIELEEEASPITVENFQKYADAEYFDGLIFHRVIPDFMIQGGGLEPGLQSRATLFPPIVNEGATSGLSNLRGTIAMARTNDPDSATSQFFINTVDNTFLDATSSKAGYAVFGKVIEGMDVVDQIEAVPTHTVGSYEDVPVDDVMIESIRVAVEN